MYKMHLCVDPDHRLCEVDFETRAFLFCLFRGGSGWKSVCMSMYVCVCVTVTAEWIRDVFAYMQIFFLFFFCGGENEKVSKRQRKG